MKRIAIFTIALCLLASVCFAGGGGSLLTVRSSQLVASGSVAQDDNRLDLTSTNAFAWLNGVDLSSYQDGRHMIQVFDSSNRLLMGYIGSTAPAGETLSGEISGDGGFDNGGYWTTNTGWSISGSAAVRVSATSGSVYTTSGFAALNIKGICVKISASASAVGGAGIAGRIVSPGQASPTYTNPGTLNWYLTITTATDSRTGMIAIDATSTATVESLSIKTVTDPPSTAAHIVSSKGGATRAWTYKHPSFDPNTNCTYKVFKLGE